ncbi:MAG: DUF58 domain-containing protein [Candidatus Scatosoma sp.]
MKIAYLNDAFFSRLETMALNLRTNLSGFYGGKHLVNTYGQTVEFSDFREYMPGDDIRRIDWNLFSRFEKYFLKLFTDERQMQVQIFIDCSASMGKDNPKKAAYALATAAALGFLAVQNMDKVSFHVMQGEKAENKNGTIVGKNAFFRAVGSLEDIVFTGEADIEKCVTLCGETGTNNGLSVIISDFFTDSNWKKAVDYLCYKKRQVLLVQVLTPEEISPAYDGRVNMIDSESIDAADEKNMKIKITRSMQKAYEEALRDFKEDIGSFCLKRNANFVSVNTETPIERMLFGELLKAGIME